MKRKFSKTSKSLKNIMKMIVASERIFFYCVTYLLSFLHDRGINNICAYLDDGAGTEKLDIQHCLILELYKELKLQ